MEAHADRLREALHMSGDPPTKRFIAMFEAYSVDGNELTDFIQELPSKNHNFNGAINNFNNRDDEVKNRLIEFMEKNNITLPDYIKAPV